ncbi:asparaginyl-tRNA synthetase [Pholiota conissans]|uniref:Asparagine--tRNA ligase, mitochondrial n=1 Tax=Pholiota conissans TaxID=109636 RepID=A0A9P5Z221_9AGAR|nr:asparaginyl-tRNA synthetase [Pholiota conissans]
MLLRWLTSPAASTSKFSLPRTIRQLLERPPSADDATTVFGWIKSIRKQKNMSFAVITDGSSANGLQAVLLKGKDDDLFKKLTNGAAVRLTGRLVSSPGAGQSHELLVDQTGQVAILGECDPEAYPIQKKDLTSEYLRDHIHLRARTAHIAAMIRLRDSLSRQINSWFDSQGFYFVNTPIITGNDAEGAGEAFRLALLEMQHPAAATTTPPTPSEFFSRPSFLTVSHQLHLEALATAISRVYTISPCFRAERSLTGRHLAEFWMVEAEWAFPQNGVHGVCDLTEALLRSTVNEVLTSEDMDILWKEGSSARHQILLDAFTTQKPWTKISYTEAVHELEAAGSVQFEYKPKWGHSLQSEHEKWLAEQLVRGPVFVTDYPTSLKPFYMRANEDAQTVACFDLLVPHVGELIGGSMREERADLLKRQMAGIGGSEWYVDLRKYGGAPHAGFGMGFERLVSWVSGIENVRECTPMPRWAGRMLL